MGPGRAPASEPGRAPAKGARSSLGIPTLFNLLGPLTNPGGARHQLIGVFAPELTEKLAAVLRELGSERAWVVHAEDGLDELSTLGKTRISELHHGKVTTRTLDAHAELGLPLAKIGDLKVSSAAESADVIRSVLAGNAGPARDIALLNAAGALVISGIYGMNLKGLPFLESDHGTEIVVGAMIASTGVVLWMLKRFGWL